MIITIITSIKVWICPAMLSSYCNTHTFFGKEKMNGTVNTQQHLHCRSRKEREPGNMLLYLPLTLYTFHSYFPVGMCLHSYLRVSNKQFWRSILAGKAYILFKQIKRLDGKTTLYGISSSHLSSLQKREYKKYGELKKSVSRRNSKEKACE